jgi:hypothetical protein
VYGLYACCELDFAYKLTLLTTLDGGVWGMVVVDFFCKGLGGGLPSSLADFEGLLIWVLGLDGATVLSFPTPNLAVRLHNMQEESEKC